MSFVRLATIVVLSVCHSAIAAETAVTILQKNCASCHGAAQMSGFDVRDRGALVRGGKRGSAVVPGRSIESLLYRAIVREGDLKMPAGKSGLTAEEIATIRSWIDSGAPWDFSVAKVESTWWSFRTPKRPAIPLLAIPTGCETP